MLKIKHFKPKNLLDLLSIASIIFALIFVILFKVFSHLVDDRWYKNKDSGIVSSKVFYDDRGKLLPKSEGKRAFFRAIGKTEGQILADDWGTYYLRASWAIPQLMPQFFNYSGVGGMYNASLFSTYMITKVVKKVAHKERPDHSNFFSFPSGHSSGTATLGGFLHKFYGKKIASPFILASIITGGSRIYANRHDFWDVSAGLTIGWACGFYTNAVCLYFINIMVRRFKFAAKIKNILLKEF